MTEEQIVARRIWDHRGGQSITIDGWGGRVIEVDGGPDGTSGVLIFLPSVDLKHRFARKYLEKERLTEYTREIVEFRKKV